MPFAPGMASPRHVAVFNELQREAAIYPGARLIPTPYSPIWMTPIESDLYAALGRVGLAPVPQFCIKGFFVDFAFPELMLAVEADGSVHQQGGNAQHDRWRDNILREAGWTVMRFHGTTIFHRADNCAFVVGREVSARMAWNATEEKRLADLRQVEGQFFKHPIKAIVAWVTRMVSPSPQLPTWPIADGTIMNGPNYRR